MLATSLYDDPAAELHEHVSARIREHLALSGPAARPYAGSRPASGDSGCQDRADGHEEGCKSAADRRVLSGAYGVVSARPPLDSQPDQLAARDMGGRPFARPAVRSLTRARGDTSASRIA